MTTTEEEGDMIFELRQYRTLPGKRDAWVTFAEERIFPSLVAFGTSVIGSFVAQEEDDLFVWILGFENEEHRATYYATYYQTDEWQNELRPTVVELLDPPRAIVTRM